MSVPNELPTSPISLPPLDGLSAEFIAHLEKLEELGEDELRIVLVEVVPHKTQKQISRLLQKQKAMKLTHREQSQLADLQHQADLVMLRKARAAVLLRFRGHQLPTLEELQNQTPCN